MHVRVDENSGKVVYIGVTVGGGHGAICDIYENKTFTTPPADVPEGFPNVKQVSWNAKRDKAVRVCKMCNESHRDYLDAQLDADVFN